MQSTNCFNSNLEMFSSKKQNSFALTQALEISIGYFRIEMQIHALEFCAVEHVVIVTDRFRL